MSPTLPRSYLVVPATEPEKIHKALASAANQVIIDLEDAVAPARKAEARGILADVLSSSTSRRGVLVRTNPVGSVWARHDLEALTRIAAVSGLVVPKVSSAGDVAFVDRFLAGAEAEADRRDRLTIQVLIESPEGLRAIDAVLAESARIDAVAVGYADLAVELGRPVPGSLADHTWIGVQDLIVRAARAAGVSPVSGPYLGLDDGHPFQESVVRAAAVGFDGMWTIHPKHLARVNEEFTPSAELLAWARRTLTALSDADSDGAGAVGLDNQMLDEALYRAAARVLERSEEAQ